MAVETGARVVTKETVDRGEAWVVEEAGRARGQALERSARRCHGLLRETSAKRNRTAALILWWQQWNRTSVLDAGHASRFVLKGLSLWKMLHGLILIDAQDAAFVLVSALRTLFL